MISFLMLGSLVFGLIAWLLPIFNIRRYEKNYNKNCTIYYFLSISSCAIALSFQLLYSNYMVQSGDLVSLMDTIGTSTVLSIILLVVTLILNVISLNVYRIKE